MSNLPSKYQFTVQESNEAPSCPPSCPPKKPTPKGKAAKKVGSKGDD